VGSRAQDDDFQEVKRRKKHISNNTSQTAKKSTKPVPISAAVKMSSKAMLNDDFFVLLRCIHMDMETYWRREHNAVAGGSKKQVDRH
jgi:hypothetical protein